MILAAFATTLGFAAIALTTHPLALLLLYVVSASLWTPLIPLTDAYALKAVARYGLNYGPLRLWGSAAFVVGALACGWLVQEIDPRHLIWVIVAMAALGAAASLALAPTADGLPSEAANSRDSSLLRDPGFLAIIVASALIQGSHAAYYTFASITWRSEGIGGLAIAALWVLGVLAEIVVFALSPRFTLSPAILVTLAGLCAGLRWILTAQSLPFAALAVIQLSHGISFGLTMVATMALLVRHVPAPIMARAQGLLAAASGIVLALTAITSGALYASIGQGLYLVMAAMALAGAAVIWAGRHRAGARSIAPQPQKAASGG